VIAWRVAHGSIAAVFLTSIGYVWWCALSGRRGQFLRPAIVALVGEGCSSSPIGGIAHWARWESASVILSPCSNWRSRPVLLVLRSQRSAF
jgi:hypothetical protein